MNFFHQLSHRGKIIFYTTVVFLLVVIFSVIYYLNNRTYITLHTDTLPISFTVADKTYQIKQKETNIYLDSGFYKYKVQSNDNSFQTVGSVNLWDTKHHSVYVSIESYKKEHIQHRLCHLKESDYCSLNPHLIDVKFYENYTWAIVYKDQEPDLILTKEGADWKIYSHTEAGAHPDGFLPVSIEEALR